jgi:pimeloyl-ACP methyl ester carboxylesterase
MRVIKAGQGPPLVLVPGIQGRWEYQRPCRDALGASFSVLTFALSGEPGAPPMEEAAGLDNDVRQVETAMSEAGVGSAVVLGISFGGLSAIRFAAAHPHRTAALILASTPGPHWRLRARHQVYARAPWIFGPLFLAESPFRLHQELLTTFPSRRDRWRFLRWQLATLGRAPVSPRRMAARAALIPAAGLPEDCARITARTLLVTGEPALDHVVPVESTLGIKALIAHAEHRTLARTGHLGSVTRPNEFARLIRDFVAASGRVADPPRRAPEATDEPPRVATNHVA